MEDNVIRFPWLDEVERDLVGLEITDFDSLKRVREIRKRTGEVLGFEYLNGLLERLVRGKPVFRKGFDPVKDAFPCHYSFHLDLLDLRDLDFFKRLADLALRKTENAPTRIRSDVFYLRSEVLRRLSEILPQNFSDKAKGGR